MDEGLTFTDLKGTIKEFLWQMLGQDLPIRFRTSYFPFTEPSAEVDLQWNGKLLEVLGCKTVDPNVLKGVGLHLEKYTGLRPVLGSSDSPSYFLKSTTFAGFMLAIRAFCGNFK